MGEMVERAERLGLPNGSSRRADYGRSSWSGTETWEQAIDLATNGWMGIREQVDNLSTSLIAQIRETLNVGIDYVHGPFGSALDIGLYAQGIPTCIVRPVFVEQPNHRKVVRILISTGATSDIDTEAIIRRGIAVTALVELLQAANRAVEIYAEATCVPGGRSEKDLFTALVQLKEASEPLDINRVMFAMGHPAWHRRITFAIRESARDLPNGAAIVRRFDFTSGGGMGRSIEAKMGDELGEDTIVLQTITHRDRWDAQASVNWIIDTLRRCGVEVEQED